MSLPGRHCYAFDALRIQNDACLRYIFIGKIVNMKRNIKKKNLRTASVSAIGARRVDSTDASAQSEADSIAAVLQSRDKGPRAMNGTTFIYDFSGVTGELGPIIVI